MGQNKKTTLKKYKIHAEKQSLMLIIYHKKYWVIQGKLCEKSKILLEMEWTFTQSYSII